MMQRLSLTSVIDLIFAGGSPYSKRPATLLRGYKDASEPSEELLNDYNGASAHPAEQVMSDYH
jgi:hypothetical protein